MQNIIKIPFTKKVPSYHIFRSVISMRSKRFYFQSGKSAWEHQPRSHKFDSSRPLLSSFRVNFVSNQTNTLEEFGRKVANGCTNIIPDKYLATTLTWHLVPNPTDPVIRSPFGYFLYTKPHLYKRSELVLSLLHHSSHQHLIEICKHVVLL